MFDGFGSRAEWLRALAAVAPKEGTAMCKGDVDEKAGTSKPESGPKVDPKSLIVSVGDRVLVSGFRRHESEGVAWAAEWVVAGFALEGDGVLLRAVERTASTGDCRDSWVLRQAIVGIVSRGNPSTITSIRVA